MLSDLRLMLFDLDGTLVDTAPDLAAVANRQRAARGLEPLPLAELRAFASQGARGLIGRALGVAPGAAQFEPLRQEFFALYEQALCVESRLFPGMDETLSALEARGVRWGIVTNKIARFTLPLVEQLGLTRRVACVVSGDTTAHAKPHPAPLLHALAACEVEPRGAAYVGDDRRDIESGRAAGVPTVVAAYGYLGDGGPIDDWGADHRIDSPADLLALISR
jgi:phosphoglycolate phosphatase